MSAPPENATFGIRDFPRALLARNTVYNVLGHVMPLALAVVTVPFLIKYMGVERFGVLSLAWMVSGYFNLFDLGIGRATTKFVADYRAMGRREDISRLVTTSLLMLTGIGLIGGVVTAMATPWLVKDILNIPEQLTGESLVAFYMMAATVPMTVLTAGTRGVLEAEQRFGIINAIKVPFSAATLLLPLAVLPFSVSLVPVIGTLVFSRLMLVVVYLWCCREHLAARWSTALVERSMMKKLIGFGGWLTVSQLLPPLMGNMDRFFIGAILTMTAVTYYVTPFDMMSKMGVFPNAILGVLFPVFSVYAIDQMERLVSLYSRAIAYILIIITPVTICLIAVGDVVLNLWLGEDFADNCTVILQLLAIGLLISSVARVAGNIIQASGRPDLTAKLFLIELPIYVGLLLIATSRYDIVGVAGVWLTRIVIETGILILFCRSRMQMPIGDFFKHTSLLVVWSALCLATAFLIAGVPNTILRVGLTVVTAAAAPLAGALVLLDKPERERLWQTVMSVTRLGRPAGS